MKDYIVRATAANDSVRIFAMTSRETVTEAAGRHKTSNVATAALGRLLTAGAMMGAMLKNESDVLTLQIGCAGPIGGITVTSGIGDPGEEGIEECVNVKGYVNNPDVDIPLKENGKLDVSGALGAGILTVIKDMGLKEPFSGQTELISGEIAEDLTYYFANSEQVPSSVALGVLVSPEGEVIAAGGFIIQLLPFAEDSVIDALEQKLNKVSSVTSMLASGKTPEDIIGDIFSDMDLTVTDRIPARFHCNCSKERVRKAILSIEEKDISVMIAEGKPAEVNCHFCGSSYIFTTEDLKGILEEKKQNE